MITATKITILNDLIIRLQDTVETYQVAGKYTVDQGLKKSYFAFAQERKAFIENLEKLIGQMGGEIEKKEPATAVVDHSWIKLQAAANEDINKAVLEVVCRVDDFTLHGYEEALHRLPNKFIIKTDLMMQRNRIEKVLQRMKNLEKLITI